MSDDFSVGVVLRTRLREADDAFIRSLRGSDPAESPAFKRWERLARRPVWRWVPTTAVLSGSAWLLVLLGYIVTGDESGPAIALAALAWLLLLSPALGRLPLSLRRNGVAAWLWWIPTIALAPLFGLGLVFAPAALAATFGYVSARVGARQRASR